MTDEEVVANYNMIAEPTQVGLAWWQDELHRRHLNRQARQIERLTWFIAFLTVVMAVVTIVNVVN